MKKESHWYHESKLFNPTLEKIDHYGFIYKITNTIDGRMYIGKKQMTSIRKLKPLKGKTRKRHKKIETDWKNYTSSSKYVNDDIKLLGINNFKFEIISFHDGKAELRYHENLLQMMLQVLEEHDGKRLFYNAQIEKLYHSPKHNQSRLDNYKLYERIRSDIYK